MKILIMSHSFLPFVSTKYLTDIFEFFKHYIISFGFFISQMTAFGLKSLPTAQVTVVRGELVTSSQVRCDTSSRGSSMQIIEVSVSNDGKVAYETYQKFIAYDPACYDCNFETCTRKVEQCAQFSVMFKFHFYLFLNAK